LDTANTGTISVSGESDETSFSPLRTPGVLDGEVILTGVLIGSIADNKDSVVELGSALG